MLLSGRITLGLLTLVPLSLARAAIDPTPLVQAAREAEARLDSRQALELFLEADRVKPGDATILQKIAQQYSDLIVDLPDDAEKKRYAQIALDFAQRAVALDPENAVNVLSLAVCHGKLAVYSDARTKVEYSRLVKEEAERAIVLDASYAWAHHVLGRWHYEVAALGGAKKWLVRAMYGGLPAASTAEGVRALRRAVELEPEELAHRLELGFACLAAGEQEQALAEFNRGLAMPSRRKHDDAAKERARRALETLGSRRP